MTIERKEIRNAGEGQLYHPGSNSALGALGRGAHSAEAASRCALYAVGRIALQRHLFLRIGSIIVEMKLNGADTVYKEGESFVEVPGEVVQARNAGVLQTSVMVSYLIPRDAPLSTVHHAAPAPEMLPATGGVADGVLPIWLMRLAAGGLIVGGWLRWRRHARALEPVKYSGMIDPLILAIARCAEI